MRAPASRPRRTSRRIARSCSAVGVDPTAAEHEVAHGAVADRGHERERRPRRVERVEVLRRPSTTASVSGPPPSSGRRYAWRSARRSRRDGRRSEAVGVDHLGREALRELRRQQRVVERAQRRVRVQVDEAGAEHQPAPVDDLARVRQAPNPRDTSSQRLDRAVARRRRRPRTAARRPGRRSRRG